MVRVKKKMGEKMDTWDLTPLRGSPTPAHHHAEEQGCACSGWST